MSWLWGSSTNPEYEELVEKACSPLNLPYPQSEDIALNLEITDLIRSKGVQPKAAMQSLKRRVASRNGRVQMYALSLVDTCIKNGGDHFLAEIASKEFVDEMSSLIKSPLTTAEVKQMALGYFQAWALAFESKRELSFLVDVYREMKSSGTNFPAAPTQTSSHLLTTTTAPTWIDSDVCMRCRSAFTFTNRKHHCRNCGLVYDQACSSKTMPLPRFGIKEPVRVCESCYAKNGKLSTPEGPAPAVPGRTPRTREDLDADLQRAIELSLAESQPSERRVMGSEPPLSRHTGSAEDDDEEMRLAIEASLREMEREKARPSAPAGREEPEFKPLPTFDLSGRETETILTFSNTMDQMAAYGERDLRRFPHAHVLAQQAYAIGGKLQRNAEEKTTKQQMLAEMQDKLSQAVTLYGSILDGQQAYSNRQYQQQQQQRQYQNQYSYNQYAPQPYPQMNGNASSYPSYAPQSYAPPPRPEPSRAGPSMYPAMPAVSQYEPQPQASYQTQQQQSYPYMRPEATGSATGIQSPYPQQNQAPPQAYQQQYSHPEPERQYSNQLQYQPEPNQPQSQTYQANSAYGAPAINTEPTTYTASPQKQHAAPTSPIAVASAPPVDMSSHPTSPTSIKSSQALPQVQPPVHEQYTSPAPPQAQALPTSPVPQSQVQQPGMQGVNPQYSTPPQQHQLPQQQNQYQQQAYQPQQQQQYNAPPQNTYSTASFPQAPSAVFPDAPSAEPTGGLEQKEKEEALLIEL